MGVKKSIILFTTFSIFATGSELVTFKSHFDINKTVNNLTNTLPKNGFKVISKINMKEWAKKGGVDINKEFVLSIGNPFLDAKLIKNDARAALELPIKIAIYKDFKGDTWVVYKNPNIYKNIYRLNKCTILEELNIKLKKSIKESIEIKIVKKDTSSKK